MVGISKTRAPGSKVLWNQRPTCLQCPALFLASTSTNISLVLCQFIPIFWLPPSQNRTRNRSSHIHVSALLFSLSRKEPPKCARFSWANLLSVTVLQVALNLSRAGSLTHSFPSDTFLADQDNSENSQSPCHCPHWGVSFSHSAKKSHKATCSPLKERFYRMFNQKKRDNSGFKVLIFGYKVPTYS